MVREAKAVDPDQWPSERSEQRISPFDVWQGGLTLARALDRFVDGRSWSRRHSRVMSRFDRLRTDPRSPMSDRAEAMARLQDMASEWEAQARLLEELRARLTDRLRAGDLLAVGFTDESGSSSKLAIVPREAWAEAAAIDWDRSGISGNGRGYVDVRVLPAPQGRLDPADLKAGRLAGNRS